MRRFRISFGITLVAGVVSLLLVASRDRRVEVQSTGVMSIVPVAFVYPGHEACERPIVTVDRIEAIRFQIEAASPHPKMRVAVRDARTNQVLASGTSTSSDPGGFVQAFLDRPVPSEATVAVCVANRGRGLISLFGDNGTIDLCLLFPHSLACRFHFLHPTSSTSSAYLDRKGPLTGTINFSLRRDQPVSILSQANAIMTRMARFRPGFVSAELWWGLLLGAVVLAPAGLWWGARGVFGEPGRRKTQ